MMMASNMLPMAGNVFTLLGAIIAIYGISGLLVRTSDTSLWAWARNLADRARRWRRRRRGPIHHQADAHLQATGILTASAIPITGGPKT